MAERPVENAGSSGAGPARHDGRFGRRFDEEIALRPIVGWTVAIAVVCALALALMALLLGRLTRPAAGVAGPPALHDPPAEAVFPTPTLQTDPEAELAAMRREHAERLSTYGWVREGQGIVHLPIDVAIELLAEADVGTTETAGAAGAESEVAE